MDEGIEFLSDEAVPLPDDDVLDVGPRRRYPRWAGPVALAVVAGLVVAAVLTRPSAGRPAVLPSGGPSTAPSLAPAMDVASETALDVAVAGAKTWVLYFDRISLVDRRTGQRAGAPYHGDGRDPDAQPRLLVDPAAGLLWVVVEGVSAGEVIEYDAATLHEQRTVPTGDISAAAVLDGRLYVTSGRLLVEIAPAQGARTVANSPTGQFFGVAADQVHRRLVVIDAGWPTSVWTYRPGAGLTAAARPLPLGKGSPAAVDGRVWVGGFGAHGALLAQVRPERAVISPLSAQLGPGAIVVAGGQHVVWVRDGAGGARLWCVDATTGAIRQRWDLSGPVASTTGVAVVATPAGPVHLHLAGCPG